MEYGRAGSFQASEKNIKGDLFLFLWQESAAKPIRNMVYLRWTWWGGNADLV